MLYPTSEKLIPFQAADQIDVRRSLFGVDL
jgi:hypothetical protein